MCASIFLQLQQSQLYKNGRLSTSNSELIHCAGHQKNFTKKQVVLKWWAQGAHNPYRQPLQTGTHNLALDCSTIEVLGVSEH